jgi:beta-phosphoglucomutase family hydrolase
VDIGGAGGVPTGQPVVAQGGRFVLGLPPEVRACLFDLDGVLTATASVHAAAWKQMFDEYLQDRATRTGEPFRPFEASDYERYVDGRPRHDGTREFLRSRGIELPEGEPSDLPGSETVYGLSTRKNDLVLALLEKEVVVFDGSVRYVRAARDAGLSTAVVSSSANANAVLAAAGIADLFDTIVDGNVAQDQHLAGKPAPDTWQYAARVLGATPASAAVFEDAIAGVQSGRAGGFARVIGVDRVGQADELAAQGADVVVQDLAELLEEEAPS